VLDEEVCYVVTRLMEGVCEADYPRGHYPSGRRTEALKRPRAGKTGTTNNAVDAWFCGFTPQFTTIVWFGYEDNQKSLGRGNEATGGFLASPVWTDFMLVAHEGLPVEDFRVPPGVEFYNVDRIRGTLGGNWREAFIRGTTPPQRYIEPQRPEEIEGLLESL
jgi:penicillin-binding protein 1A